MNKKCLTDFIIINCGRIATRLLMFSNGNIEKISHYIFFTNSVRTVQLAVGPWENTGTKL